ncbi:MAG: hypothetical protein HOV73_01785 [Streptomyces sp.]|nr:hypothetical protein [Streptomyces sp.]
MTKKTETPGAADTGQLVEEAKTEAAEVREDIKEAKAEAAEAREAGDTARADRLEQRVEGLETKLDGIAEQLKGLAERPFHPAPHVDPDPAPGQAGTQTGDTEAPKTEADAEVKPEDKPTGRTMSGRWFGDRARS